MVNEQELDARVYAALDDAGLEPNLDSMDAMRLRAEIGREMELEQAVPAEAVDERRRGRVGAYSLEHWQEVAKVYREAKAAEVPIIPYMAVHFRVLEGTANNWPRKCVAVGALEPEELNSFGRPKPAKAGQAKKRPKRTEPAVKPAPSQPAPPPPRPALDIDVLVENVLDILTDGQAIPIACFGAVLAWRQATVDLMTRLRA